MTFQLNQRVQYRGQSRPILTINKIVGDGTFWVSPARAMSYRDRKNKVVSGDALQAYDREAEKAAEMAAKGVGPCQICGRLIGCASGKIAHHGYERPSHLPGYQTESCYGARALSYLVSRDRLGLFIADVLPGMIRRREAFIEQLLDADLAKRPAIAGPVVYERMTGRKTRPLIGIEHAEYDRFAQMLIENLRREIRDLREAIPHYQKRYDAWKAPGQ